VQEPELWPWLEQRGFVRIDAGTFSVQEQIDLFHNAEVVVAPHGAALTNITFCRPGTRVLEMFAANYVHLGLWTIADAAGLEYRYLVADGDHRPGRPMHGNYTDVSIPVRRVQETIEKMLT
jgi:capsular polysaccharide biosynthesis protein